MWQTVGIQTNVKISLSNVNRVSLGLALLTTAWGLRAQTPGQHLPDAPGRDTVQKVCGACHSADLVLGRGMTRTEWSELVASMISRGAKGTQGEFAQVINYLTVNLPPKGAAGNTPVRRKGGGGGLTSGPNDKQIVDAAAAERGRITYKASCSSCHGPDARGTSKAPDLVRSLTVLHDRYGSKLGPFLQKGHPAQGATYSEARIKDLSHYLHQQFNDTLRGGSFSKVLNVLTGDPKAGEAYFNGEGGCSTCHSVTGDLAHIASKYDPPTLQQRFLFPQTVGFGRKGLSGTKPVTVTVTTAEGEMVSGVLDRMDDFDVSLHDSSGEYHSWKRTPGLKAIIHNPYAGHIELLDKYTDKDIHDVVAYLETLK